MTSMNTREFLAAAAGIGALTLSACAFTGCCTLSDSAEAEAGPG
jgi:hypothetical protein